MHMCIPTKDYLVVAIICGNHRLINQQRAMSAEGLNKRQTYLLIFKSSFDIILDVYLIFLNMHCNIYVMLSVVVLLSRYSKLFKTDIDN